MEDTQRTITIEDPEETNSSNLVLKIDISNIIIKDHENNPNFCWGSYGGLIILIMKNPKMVNITKLETESKKARHYVDLKSTKELATYFQNFYTSQKNSTVCKNSYTPPINPDSPILQMLNVSNDLKGTYLTLDMFPNFASWVSPVFYHKCSVILNKFFAFNNNLVIDYNKEMEENHKLLEECYKIKENVFKEYIKESNNKLFKMDSIILKMETELFMKDVETKTLLGHKKELIEKVNCLESRYIPNAVDPSQEEYIRITSSYNHTLNRVTYKFCARQKKNLNKRLQWEKIIWEKSSPNAINIKNRILKRLVIKYGGQFLNSGTIYIPPSILTDDQILRIAEEERRRIDIPHPYFKSN